MTSLNRPSPSHAFGLAVSRGLRRSFTLDVRGLAAFRIGLGVLLVVDCLLRSRDFSLMYTADGVFPPDVLVAFHRDPFRWSLAFLADSPWWAAVVLAAEGVVGAMLAAGWGTRVATVVAWAVVVSVIRRTMPAANAGDLWLACLLFWSMFLPLGAVWSIDARGRAATGEPPPAAALSVATVALVLQLVFVYLGAGFAKCNATWFSGEAMAHALSVHDHGRPLGMIVAQADWLARPITWAVLVAELVAPVVLVVWPATPVRVFLLVAFAVFHVAIWLTMSVGLFAAIGMTAWLPLVPAAVWDRLTGPPRSARVAALGPAGSLACGAALALAVVAFAHFWGVFGTARLPRPVSAAIAACGLEQEWAMFGMVPPQEQWVYARAVLADGSVVDLLRGGRPVEQERPSGGFGSLAGNRWHKFFWMLPRPGFRVFSDATAAALARDWNSRHSIDRQVRSLELHYAMQGVSEADAPLQDAIVAAWPPRGDGGAGNLDRLLDSATAARP